MSAALWKASGFCAALAVLAGCQPAAEKVIISPEAEAALPPGTKLSEVRRLSNGCYFIVKDKGLSGAPQRLLRPDGTQVCDPVLFEEILNPDRVAVNEKAI